MKVLGFFPCGEIGRVGGMPVITGPAVGILGVEGFPVKYDLPLFVALVPEPADVPGDVKAAVSLIGEDHHGGTTTISVPYRAGVRTMQGTGVITIRASAPGPCRLQLEVIGTGEIASWPMEVVQAPR